MVAIVVLAVAAIVGYFLVEAHVTRPRMSEIVRNARTAMTLTPAQTAGRSVDGIAFPDWRAEDWTLAGGRTDTLTDGRTATTALYVRGGRGVTLTIVAGTEPVDDEIEGTPATVTRDGHSVAYTDFGVGANALSDAALYIFKRTVDGHTVVLTGNPVSSALHAEMSDLLVTGLDPWNGAVAAATTP